MQRLNLFISDFKPADPQRAKEVAFCRKSTLDSGLFANIIEFTGRPRYLDFFEQTKNYPNDINILANDDIYFNDSIKKCLDMDQNTAYCLTRWELDEKDQLVPFEVFHATETAQARHSQDVWIVRGEAKKVYGDFNLGIPGCDNRIAYELQAAGYRVTNPSDRIQCIHKHKSRERNQNLGRIPMPYKWVEVERGRSWI